MKIFFNKDGKDNWHHIVVKPALEEFNRDKTKLPVIWYYPPELGINGLLQLSSSVQDGIGD